MWRETDNIRIGGKNARTLNARSWPIADGRNASSRPRNYPPLYARYVPAPNG